MYDVRELLEESEGDASKFITNKQFNFLKLLGKTREEIELLNKREAGKLIHNILNDAWMELVVEYIKNKQKGEYK